MAAFSLLAAMGHALGLFWQTVRDMDAEPANFGRS